MWNDNDIFANDIADKFEQKMFCNFGGGSSPSSSGGESRGVSIAGGTLRGGTTKNEAAQSGGVDYAAGGEYLGEFGGAGGAVGYQGTGYGTLSDGVYSAPESSEGVANMIAAQNRQNLINKQIAARDAALAGLTPVTAGFGAGKTAIDQLYSRISNQPLPNIGLGAFSLNKLGSIVAQGIYDRIKSGGTPVYDPTGQIVGVMTPNKVGNKIGGFLEDTFGLDLPDYQSYYGRSEFNPNQGGSSYDPNEQVYRARFVGGDIPMDEGDSYVAPEATTVVAAQSEPEKSMIEQDYRYPAGGYYPEEGRFLRQGLLDVAPTTYGGLLAGYDPTQFGAMNVGFRQPTDVGLFVDPYDVKGYTRIS